MSHPRRSARRLARQEHDELVEQLEAEAGQVMNLGYDPGNDLPVSLVWRQLGDAQWSLQAERSDQHEPRAVAVW